MSSAPSRLLGYLDAEECFTALAELCTLSDKAQPVKIHVCTTDDGNKAFVCADQAILRDIAFQTSQSKCTSGLRDRPSL